MIGHATLWFLACALHLSLADDGCALVELSCSHDGDTMTAMDGVMAGECAECLVANFGICHKPHGQPEFVMCMTAVPDVCHYPRKNDTGVSELFCIATDEDMSSLLQSDRGWLLVPTLLVFSLCVLVLTIMFLRHKRLCCFSSGRRVSRSTSSPQRRWFKFVYMPAARSNDDFTIPVRECVPSSPGNELLLDDGSDEIVEYNHLLSLCPMVLPARLNINEPIGRTRFGAIHKGTMMGDNRIDTMVHCVTSPYRLRPTDARAFNESLALTARAQQHENVVSVLGVCDQDLRLLIAMELVPGPNLQTVLRESRTCDDGHAADFAKAHRVASLLSSTRLAGMMGACAAGASHLAKCGVPHTDLAGVNVLLAAGGRPKIAGFGLASTHELYSREADRRHSSLRWQAPELLGDDVISKSKEQATEKSMVWSLGVLLWEIATLGGTPYADVEPTAQLIELVKTGHLVPKRLPSISDDLYGLCLGCWRVDPENRWSMDDVMQKIEAWPNSGSLTLDLNLNGDESFEYASIRPDLEQVTEFQPDSVKC